VRVTPSCDTINSFYISFYSGTQWSPDIAYGGGYYLAVWSDTRSSYYTIYGARVTTSGTVLEPNGLLIGYGASPYYYYPSVVYNGTNYFVIWSTGNSPYRIMGRFVNTNGTFGSDTLRLLNCSNYVYRTRMAHDGANYLVTWIEYSSVTYNYSARGQMISGTGTPIGSVFTIADTVNYSTLSVRFAAGSYLAIFTKSIGSVDQICGRYINTAGQPVGGVFNITNSSYSSYYGDLFFGADNRFLNAWAEYRGSNYDIYANLDVVIGVDEVRPAGITKEMLRSTIITRALEFTDRSIAGTVYDATGRKVVRFNNGYCDCTGLNSGVYIIKTDDQKQYRVIKVK
jgi:hypothetical protein